jgi:hypothetical protein
MADIGHRQSFIADMPLGSSHSSAVSRNDRSFSLFLPMSVGSS